MWKERQKQKTARYLGEWSWLKDNFRTHRNNEERLKDSVISRSACRSGLVKKVRIISDNGAGRLRKPTIASCGVRSTRDVSHRMFNSSQNV